MRRPVEPEAVAVVSITVGGEVADSIVEEIPADFGRGFKVEKIGLGCGESAYHVNVEGDRRTCKCHGFNRWQHCKHSDGLAALIAVGRL